MIAPKNLFEKLSELTQASKIVVAYSGGLDSHVLLHLVSQVTGYQVRAVHVNHGLQEEANVWSEHCKNTCDKLKIPLELFTLNLEINKGDSLEEIARRGRYQSLMSSMQMDEVLLTAHHQRDQAETLLLQLLRGSGIAGLASMPNIAPFGVGEHARPLLDVPLPELEGYANHHHLSYIEDPSNKNIKFDRNFLRQEIFPLLRERRKGIDRTLARVATHQGEAKTILDEVAEQDFLTVQSALDNTVSIKSLLKLSLARQKLVIRFWISQSGFQFPSEKKLDHIFTNIIDARDDAQPLLEWRGVQLRRYKNRLYIMPPLGNHDTKQSLLWDTRKPVEIPSLGLRLERGILSVEGAEVYIRFRQGGEEIHVANRKLRMSLKKYMNEVGIPPWLRSRVPLICEGEKVKQVINIGYRTNGNFFVLSDKASQVSR